MISVAFPFYLFLFLYGMALYAWNFVSVCNETYMERLFELIQLSKPKTAASLQRFFFHAWYG